MLNSIKLMFCVSLTLNHTTLTGFSDRQVMFFNYAILTHSLRASFETSIRIGKCSFVMALHSNCAERCNYFWYFVSLCLWSLLSLIYSFRLYLLIVRFPTSFPVVFKWIYSMNVDLHSTHRVQQLPRCWFAGLQIRCIQSKIRIPNRTYLFRE